jgi:hypothetical protein
MRKPANGSQLQESAMIVMTTGLSGLVALMRQEERAVEPPPRPQAGHPQSLQSIVSARRPRR